MSSTLIADTGQLIADEAEPTPEEVAEMQSAMREMYTQIEASNARMQSNRFEIERLGAETRVILDSISRMLGR